MSYGPDLHDTFRRAATFVDRILNPRPRPGGGGPPQRGR